MMSRSPNPDSQSSGATDDGVSSVEGSQGTQPVNGEDDSHPMLGQNGPVWAHLVSRSRFFRSVSVRSNSFSVGKMDCDYLLDSGDIPSDCISQYSRKHFVLEKVSGPEGEGEDHKDFDVFITDCSMNGTYVNGEKVGRGKVCFDCLIFSFP